MSVIAGKAIKYDDNNINTDDIMNNAYTAIYGLDPKQIGKYCLIHYDPTFVQRVGQGDILVSGYNFGCGSSKPAALALIGAGIEAVVAKSFSRLFFRNAINLGLLPIESAKIVNGINDGDRLEIDLEHQICLNVTQGTRYSLPNYPKLIGEIIGCGGIVNWIKRQKNTRIFDDLSG